MNSRGPSTGHLTEKHAFELLSRAYVSAVASRAQAHLTIASHGTTFGGSEFDYGIDGQFKMYGSKNGIPFPKGRGVDFQLKATKNWQQDGDHVVYDIKSNAYNKLVLQNQEDGDKCLLLLLCIPESIKNAVQITNEHCSIKKNLLWEILRGEDIRPDSTKRIRIPSSNLFTDNALMEILDLAKRGAL